jgi:prepilin-type N-terminal cleavage/methylation domain-containing protein
MPQKSWNRSAFTLMEIMIVIAIIGILVSLLMVAVVPIMSRGPELVTWNDISQLGNALEDFRARFKNYPPSQIFLSNNYNDYPGVHDADLAWLNKLFPSLSSFWPLPANQTAIDWTGGAGGMPVGGVTLQADQCLVFFLGGISTPDGQGVNGFSTNPTNPAQQGGDRIGPFFEFQTVRLFKRAGSPFFSYQDGWKKLQPYLFFSSGKKRNGYQDADATLGVAPYYEATGPKRYVNPSTYQIISAGRDSKLGAGGQWTSATADGVYPYGSPGYDDQTNMNSGNLMGVSNR